MKTFINDNFCLDNRFAEELYHRFAEPLPIFDYHSHLSPKEIAEDACFENLFQIWLKGDHYKWRAMRSNGVPEKFCTGNAGDYDKFIKWAETVPYTLRNPLYHWSHLELLRYFGIDDVINPSNAPKIWEEANSMLRTKEFSPVRLLRKMQVELVCTTDDPADNLKSHEKLKIKNPELKVLPTWRPDQVKALEDVASYNAYLLKLSEAAGIEINSFQSLLEALKIRHAYFHTQGCRLSDTGIDTFYADDFSSEGTEKIVGKILSSKSLDASEVSIFKSALMYELAIMDFESGWVQQFHQGAMRNNNSCMFRAMGADTGFDSIGDKPVANSMARFFSRLDQAGKLAKTIVYNLNPSDNEVFATMIGNFQDGETPGKMQWGPAWWFLDQKDGMEKYINALSNLGLLSRFVGMTTDSRSFMSYPRHEYFRRILCNQLGKDIEKGLLPNDTEWIGKIVSDICYYNAKQYFNW